MIGYYLKFSPSGEFIDKQTPTQAVKGEVRFVDEPVEGTYVFDTQMYRWYVRKEYASASLRWAQVLDTEVPAQIRAQAILLV